MGSVDEKASENAGKEEEAEMKLIEKGEEAESRSAEKIVIPPSKTVESKPRRGGWAPNPCPYLGGSPEAEEPSTSATKASSSNFQYQHPSINYSVELTVMDDGAVQCPGCGDPKKQLVTSHA